MIQSHWSRGGQKPDRSVWETRFTSIWTSVRERQSVSGLKSRTEPVVLSTWTDRTEEPDSQRRSGMFESASMTLSSLLLPVRSGRASDGASTRLISRI